MEAVIGGMAIVANLRLDLAQAAHILPEDVLVMDLGLITPPVVVKRRHPALQVHTIPAGQVHPAPHRQAAVVTIIIGMVAPVRAVPLALLITPAPVAREDHVHIHLEAAVQIATMTGALALADLVAPLPAILVREQAVDRDTGSTILPAPVNLRVVALLLHPHQEDHLVPPRVHVPRAITG